MKKQGPTNGGYKPFYIVSKYGPDDVSLWQVDIQEKDIRKIANEHWKQQGNLRRVLQNLPLTEQMPGNPLALVFPRKESHNVAVHVCIADQEFMDAYAHQGVSVRGCIDDIADEFNDVYLTGIGPVVEAQAAYKDACMLRYQQMDIGDRLAKFNEDNDPFWIIDYEDGKFGMLLSVHMAGPNKEFGQFAFDRFAFERGETPKTQDGFYTHGNGYEWEAVFKHAFQTDPKLPYVTFDSEAGMFCCRSFDFEVLEDLGSKFKALCDDKPRFGQVVYQALSQKYGIELESSAPKLDMTL